MQARHMHSRPICSCLAMSSLQHGRVRTPGKRYVRRSERGPVSCSQCFPESTIASRLHHLCNAALHLHLPVDGPGSKKLNGFVECVVAIIGNHLLHPHKTASRSKRRSR